MVQSQNQEQDDRKEKLALIWGHREMDIKLCKKLKRSISGLMAALPVL